MIRLVLFDVDDTLLPTTEVFWASVQETLRERYGAAADELVADVLRLVHFYGTTEYRGFFLAFCAERELVGDARVHEHERLCQAYKAAFARRIAPRRGARELLELLRAQGRILGVISNGRAPFQRMKLARAGLAELIDGPVLVSGDFPPSFEKPNPHLFVEALRRCGVPPGEAVFVGDRTEDVIGGNVAGLHTVRFETAEHPPAPDALRVAHPRRMVSELAAVAAVVAELDSAA